MFLFTNLSNIFLQGLFGVTIAKPLKQLYHLELYEKVNKTLIKLGI